jgi:hypothetical protein
LAVLSAEEWRAQVLGDYSNRWWVAEQVTEAGAQIYTLVTSQGIVGIILQQLIEHFQIHNTVDVELPS